VGFWSTTICNAISLLPGSKLFKSNNMIQRRPVD
jgi:hypothetical protein